MSSVWKEIHIAYVIDGIDIDDSVLYDVWNNAEMPAYKSRLGWNSTQEDPKKKRSA